MKKIIFALLAVIMLSAGFGAYAQQAIIEDDAELFSRTGKENISQKAEALASETGAEVVIKTVNDADGYTAEEYSQRVLDEKGIDGSAIIFLIDMGNRKMWIHPRGEIRKIIYDDDLDSIIEDLTPAMKDGDYDRAAEIFVARTEKFYRKRTNSRGFGDYITDFQYLLICAVIALAVALIAILCMYGYGNRTNKMKSSSADYLKEGTFNLTVCTDNFINTTRTVRTIESSSGGSSGSSGGGNTSSGRGGSF